MAKTVTGTSFIYELRSVNLQNLPEAEQAAVLDRFVSFLNSLTEPVTIRVVRDGRTSAALGAVYEGPYIRFFIEASSQVDGLISTLGTKFVRVPSIPDTEPLHVGPRYIIDSEKRFLQVYNITRLGGSVPPAFLTAVYPFVHSLSVEIAPLDIYDAKKLARKHARSVGNRLMLRQIEGRSLDPDEQVEYERVGSAATLIARGVERLFTVRTKVVLRENTYEELVAARKKLKQVLGGVVGEIDSPKYLQEPLLTGKGPGWATGRWLYTTTSGASLFFPFAGLDVMDPTGVLLGQNLQTENAIIYDLFEKENYNLGILGSSMDYNESLLYKESGEVKMGKIGGIVNRFFERGQEGPVYTSSLEVVSFDPQTLEVGWAPVSYVYRHRYEGEMLRFRLQTGRSVVVTPNHSIFVLRDGVMHCLKAAEMRIGDYVVSSKRIPDGSSQNVRVDLIKELKGVRALYLYGVPMSFISSLHIRHSQKQFLKERRMLPMYFLPDALVSFGSVRIGNKGSTVTHERFLEIDEDIARLLGYYAAEGHCLLAEGSVYAVQFTLGKKDITIVRDLLSILYRKFGLRGRVHRHGKNGLRVSVNDRVLVELLKNWVGMGAHKKRIPPAIFNSPTNVRRAFLITWLKGDDGVSVSEELMDGAMYLLLFERTLATVTRGTLKSSMIEGRVLRGGGEYFRLRFPRPKSLVAGQWYRRRMKGEPVYPVSELPKPLSTLNKKLVGGSRTRVTDEILSFLEDRIVRLEKYAGTRTMRMRAMRRDGVYRTIVGKFYTKNRAGWLVAKPELALLQKEFENVKQLNSSDLAFLRIVGIEQVKPSSEFVYDVSVPGRENFFAGFGGVFCHNTGYGKSTFIKSYLARMALAYPEMMVFLFDSIVKPEYAVGPDGKFESSFAGLTGCAVHRFSREKGAGLDPFAVFPDKRRAANFLASVAKVEEEPELVADLYIAAEKSSSIDELLANAPKDLRKRLDASLPPYMFLFRGEMEIYPRMVFVLYDVPPGELRDAAAFLTLSAVWKFIQEKVPTATRKAVVIDEGWSLVETNPRTGKPYFPLAVEYVPEIARTGRHYNAAFVIATQLVSDFMGRGDVYGPGRAMIESCATKVVLHQDQAASPVLREAFNLSESENRFVVNAKIGQGLLVTQEGHVLFYNFLSDTELRYFTTRPKEVTA